MAVYRIARTGRTNAQAAPDPLRPADPLLSALLRADAAGPRPQEAPPLANDDSYTTNDASVVTGNLLANDTPGDVPLAVTAVNGSALAVDREIILASGARLRVNADGSFTYNPNGAFNSLPTTNDVFAYTVAGGDTATVTITVEDPPNPNIGTDNPETLTGTPGDDVMDARGGDDIVNALGGNDSIDGGTGADQLNGSTGNDTYFIDNAGDTITELDGEGYDVAIATAHYVLAAGVYLEELNAVQTSTVAISLTGNGFDNIIRGGRGNDTLTGLGGNDALYGGVGRDTMVGGTGDDVYYVNSTGPSTFDLITEAAGEGYDIAIVTEGHFAGSFNFVLNAGAHVELIMLDPTATPTGVGIAGNELDQEIRGSAGHDQLIGGGGADLLVGFAGNDNYTIDLQDTVVEQENGGLDTIHVTFDYTIMANVENMNATSFSGLSLVGNALGNLIQSGGGGGSGGDIILGGDGDDDLRSGGGNDSLYGEVGNDSLNGQSGSDLMDGGVGADIYFVDSAGDVVIEAFEAGQSHVNGDHVRSSINYTLAADQHIERLSADQNGVTLTGNDMVQSIGGYFGNETLNGMGGDDILNGGLGTDTTDGGFGDDSHYVDSAGDVVVERAGEGRDTVYADVSYVLGAAAHVEALATTSGTGSNNINLTGNGFAQEIYGNEGRNILNGGGGADYLAGGGDDDTYQIVSGSEAVVENANNGRDVVYTGISYALAAGTHVEVLAAESILATTAINLAGNGFNNEIYGNNGANILSGGGGGGDYLVGWGGDDTYFIQSGSEIIVENLNGGRDVVYSAVSYALANGTHVEVLAADSILATTAINLAGNSFNNEIYGNNGANMLFGGGGGDYLVGWGGDDTYFIQSGGEIIVEDLNGGRDVVYTAISYSLAAGTQVEVLAADSIVATTAINFAGNELNNEIYGNNGANILSGGGGGDYLVGWGGDDTYFIQSGGEIIVEALSGGRDVVYTAISYGLAAGTHVEVLAADSIAATTAIDLTGNELVNEVYGNNGANRLNGGAGSDYLAGFGGADNFAFTTALGSGNVDVLADFSVVDDTILLDNAVFAGLADGALAPGAFVTGAAAGDLDDRIVYNSATGQIFFDADGSGAGAQVHFATVTAGTILTASDFQVI